AELRTRPRPVEIRAQAAAHLHHDAVGRADTSRFLPEIVSRLSTAMLTARHQHADQTPATHPTRDELDLSALAARVEHAWRLRQQANYVVLGGHLAQLIPEVEIGAAETDGDD